MCFQVVVLFFFSFWKLKVRLLNFHWSHFSLSHFFYTQTLYIFYSHHYWLTGPQLFISKVTANASVSGIFSRMLDRCSLGSAKLATYYYRCGLICSLRLVFLIFICPFLSDVTCTSLLLTCSAMSEGKSSQANLISSSPFPIEQCDHNSLLFLLMLTHSTHGVLHYSK